VPHAGIRKAYHSSGGSRNRKVSVEQLHLCVKSLNSVMNVLPRSLAAEVCVLLCAQVLAGRVSSCCDLCLSLALFLFFSELLCALEATNPPSVKQYQEGILTYLLWKHQHLITELLLPQLLDLSKGGAATASHVLITVQACLHSSHQEQLMPLLALHLLPWTNHHTHNIRTFAQLGFCALLEAQPLDSWPAWQQGLGQGGIGMVQALRVSQLQVCCVCLGKSRHQTHV
jgi:hypothetical protein